MGAKKRMMRSRSSVGRLKREFGAVEPWCVLSDAMFGYTRYSLTRLMVAEDFVRESWRRAGRFKI